MHMSGHRTMEKRICGSAGKESACNVRDLGSIPQLGRSPGEGKGYPLQYSGLQNSKDCIVRGNAKSQTCRILVPRPKIEPRLRAVKALSLNHWTTRKLPPNKIFDKIIEAKHSINAEKCTNHKCYKVNTGV